MYKQARHMTQGTQQAARAASKQLVSAILSGNVRPELHPEPHKTLLAMAGEVT